MFCSSRRRHTRWPRDWSSDVCSSDLIAGEWMFDPNHSNNEWVTARVYPNGPEYYLYTGNRAMGPSLRSPAFDAQIGRASCREKVSVLMAPDSVQKKIEITKVELINES